MIRFSYIIYSLLMLFIATDLNAASGPEGSSAYQVKPLVIGQHAMIVTNNPVATKAAQQILRAGGNAFDAAIAAGFVLGLTEPQSSGLGGGGYALTYTHVNNALLAYDGREIAPHSANPGLFLDKEGQPIPIKQAILSAESIAVPGEVALFYRLHQDKGQLPWNDLLQPAIKLANKGFPMSPRLHKLLSADRDILKNNAEIRSVYFEGDQIKSIGSIVKNPAYANTLRIIAKNPSAFYRGNLADEIIHDINLAAGKTLYDKNDFNNYKVIVKPPICANYREKYRICSVPPSSSGGLTTLELLGIYAINYQGTDYNDPEWMYQFLEASKLAFADRNQYLADPAFVKQPESGLLAKNYLQERAQQVKDSALRTPVAAGVPQVIDEANAPDKSEKKPGTTSIVIVDKEENAISMTITVESQFGSHVFTHGFFLNNEMTDFSFNYQDASGKPIANRVEPGKRPRSSISPVIVFDQNNHLYALSGSPGGSDIICYVAKNLILLLDMKMKPNSASNTPNLCAANQDPAIENFVKPVKQVAFLEQKGETIIRKDMVSGVTNIVKRANGGWFGAADPRREGLAQGM